MKSKRIRAWAVVCADGCVHWTGISPYTADFKRKYFDKVQPKDTDCKPHCVVELLEVVKRKSRKCDKEKA